VGTGLSIPDSPAHESAVLVIGGAKRQAFLERISVPLGMWRPSGSDASVPLRLSRLATIEIAGQPIGFRICHEQLLV